MNQTADIVICGAGITGVAAAYYLSKAGVKDILLIDERPPLTLTSDHSTECYRNWWPDPAMLALTNHSIDLMEKLADESGNIFHMNRRGYLYITAQKNKIPSIAQRAKIISTLGAGPLRIHNSESGSNYQPAAAEGYKNQPSGADLLIGSELIQKHYPYLTHGAEAALHVRRAGWLSAQQLGMCLLETARMEGARYLEARIEAVTIKAGGTHVVCLSNGENIEAPLFINAAGPFLKEVGRMFGVVLPVYTELHLKAVINDSLEVVHRHAPLLIWEDAQELHWEADERDVLRGDEGTRWLTDQFPAGVHTRPEGGEDSHSILMLWDYKTNVTPPVWPPSIDEEYPEITVRGLTSMLPRMKEYFNRMPKPQVDGGYYTRTRENRPLIGQMGENGAFVIGAVSGFGIMSACGAGDLLARIITKNILPAYASEFELSRYSRPGYLKNLDQLTDNGQL